MKARLSLQLGGEKRVGFRSSSGPRKTRAAASTIVETAGEKEDTRKNLNPGVNEKKELRDLTCRGTGGFGGFEWLREGGGEGRGWGRKGRGGKTGIRGEK
ncbi:hypothetical protein ACRE_084140 [Hapsidospora chrysogenum ATCC 11550]|uniref:Uncharacterized protein n=1 Tax=Hapsidospora chrysogenum (strain ATCC 11550 / CBS 779.69 / DSM 880 / IAM 14645 / JCM 23072 / IMI 49137) TaxID=857340 RepID=A0A086SUV2_HAPC1|nr:hypothetical protein ACRE_084140 [Hapsidospora chrysogenum ATCC 11550]